MLSVIIPARNECFLQKTIETTLAAAKGEIEIIAVLEGYWPDPPVKDDPRVILIHHTKPVGMRPAVNQAAQLASGEYIMKLDAHCLLDEGFDVKLAADCEYDWAVVPRRYELDTTKWVKRGRRVVDYMYLSKPDPKDKYGGFRGMYWPEYAKRKDAKNKMIDDLICSQGSLWYMHKDKFFEIGCMDEGYGHWGQEGEEMSFKIWLSGGRVIRNKNTWYAHWQKAKNPKRRGRGVSKRMLRRSYEYSRDMWLNDKWPQQTRSFKWLIKKFMPMPTWGKDDVERLNSGKE